jgi:long-chain acyl-CoA synthetase
MPPVLVDELLASSAERQPDKTAVVCGSERWTYAEIDAMSARFGVRLVEAGAEPGDRVAICLENSVAAVAAIFGALKAGCAFVVINPRSSLDHLRVVLVDSGAFVLVTKRLHSESIAAMRGHLPGLDDVIDADAELAARRQAPPRTLVATSRHRGDNDLAALVYTSGSTGEPKGVMLTHGNITSAAAAICTYLRNTEDDVILNALPLAFTYGLGQMTTAFRVGATMVLEKSFAYPRAIVDAIARERVTGLPLVPTMATLLLRQPNLAESASSLRYITNAAAALPEPRIHELLESFPRAALYSMYGQTECQRASYLPPHQIAVRPDSVGIPIPGTSARVVNESGATARRGTVGELVVRGPHVMAGYWNRPDATRAALRQATGCDGVELHTGDLFRTDGDGYLYFVERKDDIIKCGGEKVAPKHVESTIAQLQGVAEVAVFGVPDDVLGEVVTAVISTTSGATVTGDEVRRHCQRHLDPHEVPRFVHVRGDLPTTLTGKISRRAVRAAALAERWPA